MSQRRTPPRTPKFNRLSEDRLTAMIEEATVDCYDESEQLTGWFTMIEENLEVPFHAVQSVCFDQSELSRDRSLASMRSYSVRARRQISASPSGLIWSVSIQLNAVAVLILVSPFAPCDRRRRIAEPMRLPVHPAPTGRLSPA
jgi:hypothetical protein